MSVYSGTFAGINQIEYQVKITTNIGTENKQITLGVPPIIVEWDEGETIYHPVKCSSATIKIITPEIIEGLMVSSPQDSTVELIDITNNNTQIWRGHLIPNIYTQAYDYNIEELELNCIDDLAAMEYLTYSDDGAESVYDIIKSLHHNCNRIVCQQTYRNEYMPETGNFLKYIYFNTAVFKEKTEKEVLTQLMQYLNMTAVQIYGKLELICYECLDDAFDGSTTYLEYRVSDDELLSTETAIRADGDLEIDFDDVFKETGTQIGTTEVYKDITINGSCEDFKEFRDYFKNDEYVSNNWTNVLYNRNGSTVTYSYPTSIPLSVSDSQSFFRIKPKTNEQVQTIAYNGSLQPTTTANTSFDTLRNSSVASIYLTQEEIRKDSYDNLDDNLNSTDYFIVANNTSSGQAVDAVKLTYDSPMIVGNKGYIEISGELAFARGDYKTYFLDEQNEVNNYSIKKKKEIGISMRVRVGNYYYTRNQGWIAAPANCDIWTDCNKGDNVFNKFYPLRTTENPDFVSNGSIIPLEGLPDVYGELEVTLRPKYTIECTHNGQTVNVQPQCYFLKNFNVSYTNDIVSNEPIQYYNQINNSNITSYEHTNLLTTFNESDEDFRQNPPCNNFSLRRLYPATMYRFLGEVESKGETGFLEEHTVNNLYHQYSTNTLTVEFNGNNGVELWQIIKWDILGGRRFVIVYKSIDYRLQTARYKLVEKKG